MSKKYVNNAVFLFVLFALSSCSSESVFTTEVKEIVQPGEVVEITADRIETDHMYSQFFAVYDTLLISSCPNSSDYKFYVSDLTNNQLVGSFMRYGQGPDEYLGLTPVKRIERKGDDLISLTYEPNKRQLIEWNITQSIENGRDSILRIGYYQDPTDLGLTYSALYRIGKSEYLGYTPGVTFEENMLVPAYWILEGPNIEPVKSISLVKELIPNPHSKVYDGNFFNSFTSLSPDNTKIVNAMDWLEQINIINLQNDSVASYRIEGSPDESIFRTKTGPVICQYQDVVCDTNTIYALYFGEPSDMFKDLHGCYWVHEFDWDGNFKAKYHLPVPILSLWLDPSNNTLYGYNLEEDGLYKLNISSH